MKTNDHRTKENYSLPWSVIHLIFYLLFSVMYYDILQISCLEIKYYLVSF